jgi:hypothetical protein
MTKVSIDSSYTLLSPYIYKFTQIEREIVMREVFDKKDKHPSPLPHKTPQTTFSNNTTQHNTLTKK